MESKFKMFSESAHKCKHVTLKVFKQNAFHDLLQRCKTCILNDLYETVTFDFTTFSIITST